MAVTYVDAGVLIAAARGNEDVSSAAMSVLTDPSRTFAASEFLWLETVPKPRHHGHSAQADFAEAFIRAAITRPASWDRVTQLARDEALALGLGAVDALHLACAIDAGAEEFFTAERSSKPICRCTRIRVVSIRPA